ncbi:effector binding domain-containing protein [Listeria costaricensis]|uniref:effector binding domain-containing protein n=1 Tax=Listeria costaricensis TaxID=2026604 RepID=UPI000C06B293|nr:effector binding domain-containing protein [Listeria costaricensis]
MSFETIQHAQEVFSGSKVEIPAFNPQEGLGKMSEIKAAAIAKHAEDKKAFVGINTNIEDKQYYLVAKAGNGEGDTTFEFPAGLYAKFETTETDRAAIDQFIGQAYGEVAQSEKVGIGGNFNLEDFRDKGLTLYIPVFEK